MFFIMFCTDSDLKTKIGQMVIQLYNYHLREKNYK